MKIKHNDWLLADTRVRKQPIGALYFERSFFQCGSWCPFIFLRKTELVVLLKLCCGCLCSVSLPHNVVGCSAVCDIVAFPGHPNFFIQIF